MKRRVIAALVATVLTLVGGALVAAYVVGADQRAAAKLEPTPVLVVTQSIPQGGAAIIGENVELREVPRSVVVPGAIASAESISDLVAATMLHPGEQLLPDRFVAPEDLSGDAVLVPEEFVQVTVVLAPERVIGGRLKAGDTVGVVLSLEEPAPNSQTILHRVLVSRVQGIQPSEEAGENAPPEGSQFVTFAVTAPDAERIVWSSEFGRIWLTLERETSLIEGTRQVTLENVAS